MEVDRTSLERIRNATFPSAWAWRGYDKIEVHRFLDALADWLGAGEGGPPAVETGGRDGEHGDVVAELESRIEQLENEASKAKRRERRLVEELKSAQEKLRARPRRRASASSTTRPRSTGSTKPARKGRTTGSTRAVRKQGTTGSTRAVRKQGTTGSTRAVRKRRATGSTPAVRKQRTTGSTRAVGRTAKSTRKSAAAESGPREGATDVNKVDFDQLREIGLSITQSALLIALRDTRGGFKSLDELEDVQGLSKTSVEKLRASLYVGSSRKSR